MRVFLDVNVLFSASNEGSNIAKLIDQLMTQGTAVTNDFALEEARRNVELKPPGWIDRLRQIVARLEIVPTVQFDLPVELAEKDRPILCMAIDTRCEALVTGDKRHFGHLFGHVIEGVRVVTLVQLAVMLTRGQHHGG